MTEPGEGWRSLPDRYDDGGVSGGAMERPALRRLLADIRLGRVDVVVVYKIDRLTRSLADFARIVELFDVHDVSFVSVTQAFNTTSSMGRLTLNVLLSFAQFEREVTGERIRDKIAASKAKGMWMGGVPPLGYDPPAPGSRALRVNHAEAETVRHIFRTYLALGSVHDLERRLEEEGVRSKRRTTAKGREMGGKPFRRGALFHLLRSRTYLGMITHKGEVHPGQHPAIVDADLFDDVQRQLDANARRKGRSRDDVVDSPLKGRIFDADGAPMSPATLRGARGKLYRFYVSAPLQQGRKPVTNRDAVNRAPAAAFEARLAEIVARLVSEESVAPIEHLKRVDIHAGRVRLRLAAEHIASARASLRSDEILERDPDDAATIRIVVPLRVRLRGGRSWIAGGGPPAARPDPVLIDALRKAHAMVGRDARGLLLLAAAPETTYRRRLARLAFLAPEI